jgi:CheY-like chemotaxis protein
MASKTRPVRIVVVDDEEFNLDLVETLVRGWNKEVTLLKFRNRDEAWQELLNGDPDLLITDMLNDNVRKRAGKIVKQERFILRLHFRIPPLALP